MRIAALGGTAFLVATLAHPAQADWSVKRTSNAPLVNEIAHALEARPSEAQLANRLVRVAPKPALERILGELAERAARSDDDARPLLAYAQLLLSAGRAGDAARVFEQAATAAEHAAAKNGAKTRKTVRRTVPAV